MNVRREGRSNPGSDPGRGARPLANGYGAAGTVPMAWSAPEYDHDLLKPIAYDLDLARKCMEKAGYTY